MLGTLRRRAVSNDKRYVVYGSVKDCIVELLIDRNGKNNLGRKVDNYKYALYKTKEAYVDNIYNKFDEKKQLKNIEYNGLYYKVGDNIKCETGIYFYMTKRGAYYEELYAYNKNRNNINERYKLWYENGNIKEIYNYKYGEQLKFHENGKIKEKYYMINGNIYGPCVHYHNNGKLHLKYTVINNVFCGLYQVWNMHGILCYQCNYVNGIRQYELYFSNGNISLEDIHIEIAKL